MYQGEKQKKKEIEMDNILGGLGKVLYRDCHRRWVFTILPFDGTEIEQYPF